MLYLGKDFSFVSSVVIRRHDLFPSRQTAGTLDWPAAVARSNTFHNTLFKTRSSKKAVVKQSLDYNGHHIDKS